MNGILNSTNVNSILEIFIILPFEDVATSVKVDFHKLLELVVGENLCYHQHIIENKYFAFNVEMVSDKF